MLLSIGKRNEIQFQPYSNFGTDKPITMKYSVEIMSLGSLVHNKF